MGGSSLLTIFRSKQDNRRSQSSPPTDRAIEWDDLPAEYRPVGPLGVRTIPIQPHLPQVRQTKLQISPSIRQEVQQWNKKPSVLLQLPPPRAMWRRSLEDMSPTKKREWLQPKDIDEEQMSFNIACALPPQFFDRTPAYGYECAVSPMSDDDQRRAYRPSTAQINSFEDFRQEVTRMPTFVVSPGTRSRRLTETELQIESAVQQLSPDLTIDTLLTHPMLRTSR